MTKLYENLMTFGNVDRTKMPSLEEFLGVASGDEAAAFDDKTDSDLEKIALRKFEEAKRAHGG